MNSDRQYDRTMELWRSYSIATSLELAAHLENFAILFSYNSGKIENRINSFILCTIHYRELL